MIKYCPNVLACKFKLKTSLIVGVTFSLLFVLNLKCFAQDDDWQIPEDAHIMACSPLFPLYLDNIFTPTVIAPADPNIKVTSPYQIINPVSTALELFNSLSLLRGRNCNDAPFILYIEPGVNINLGELPPEVFPLEIPVGVTLEGDFDLFKLVFTEDGLHQSYGTRIYFPYLMEYGYENRVPDIANNNSPSCNHDFASAFKLLDRSTFKNICLIGPTPDACDWRSGPSIGGAYRNYCDPSLKLPPHEGFNSGLYIYGNECTVNGCEIYGFRHNGVQVRDMIRNNSLQSPISTDCISYDSSNFFTGKFFFHHNYIHNNKGYGYGYGLYVSAGSNFNCDNSTVFYNKTGPEEVGYIHNNFFYNNKHDLDASGVRTSLDVRENTFSNKSILENVHIHNGGMSVQNPTPTYIFNSNTNGLSQVNTYDDVGCSVSVFENNVFYRGSPVDVVYPNTNICAPTTGYYVNYNFYDAKLEFNGNYFKTAPHTYSYGGGNIDWYDAANNKQDGYNFIKIGDYFHYRYYFKNLGLSSPTGISQDPNIQIDEITTKENRAQTVPFDLQSRTPEAEIASTLNTQVQSNNSEKFIYQGGKAWFDTKLCKDKSKNSPPQSNTLNLWNFGSEGPSLSGEVRTDHTNSNNPILHTFSKIGINYVTLMSIDNQIVQSNEWRASDIAKQLIMVAPDYNTDRKQYLSFWIKDTYIGRQLTPNINTTGHGTNHGVDDTRIPAPVELPTGFVKYASINDIEVWHDDIAGDSGWQYVLVNLGDYLAQETTFLQGRLEIGVRTVSDVDAERIRGFTFYVDDVYINCQDGKSAIKNGSFEFLTPKQNDPHIPYYTSAISWSQYDEGMNTNLNPPFVANAYSCPNAFSYNASGMAVHPEDSRSGNLAYKGVINQVKYTEYSPGTVYRGGNKYKYIYQDYDVHVCGTSWLKDSNNIQINVYPAPATAGSKLTIEDDIENPAERKIELFDMQGTLLLQGFYNGNVASLVSPLQPGIYLLRITNMNQSIIKKIFITQ